MELDIKQNQKYMMILVVVNYEFNKYARKFFAGY